MTDNVSPGLATELAYFQAWTTEDFDVAMQYIADDIVCRTPGGPVTGAAAFRAFMEPFARSVVRAEVVAGFGEGDTAVLVYDTETTLVADAPGAEHVTVVDGRIAQMRIIFDRLPFDAARRAAG
ncbi:nuclear transport factor 2 family protein [Cellulomonas alba]|uniref:Nuclear transport factor 2 family protein n=1 Tax=Cellulomonas alba TaxID=3053467 RepID=A0ABT7SFN1_9CELL|nr:nuclear transport factor 2 family protein [Cellulomonas alba]MDM7854996.1 nuclear transport factor 2 family protein [Cellulomonas alba]